MSEPKKICTTCGREFPATAEYFHRQKQGKYGVQAQCKECSNIRNAAYRVEHREHYAEYREAHREEQRAYLKNYNATRLEENCQRAKAWRITHPEEYRTRHTAYRLSPRGKEVARINSHNRRALKRAQGDTISKAEYAEVLKAHTNKHKQIICAWCGKPVGDEWHFDHWIPLNKGGKHEAGNIRVMHGASGDKCNLVKGAKLPFEFGKLI